MINKPALSEVFLFCMLMLPLWFAGHSSPELLPGLSVFEIALTNRSSLVPMKMVNVG